MGIMEKKWKLLYDLGLRDVVPIMENQMEEKTRDETEATILCARSGV